MPAKTQSARKAAKAAQRQSTYEQRQRDRGLVRFCSWVTPETAAKMRALLDADVAEREKRNES